MPDFKKLADGYHRFRTTDWPREHARWEELTEGLHVMDDAGGFQRGLIG